MVRQSSTNDHLYTETIQLPRQSAMPAQFGPPNTTAIYLCHKQEVAMLHSIPTKHMRLYKVNITPLLHHPTTYALEGAILHPTLPTAPIQKQDLPALTNLALSNLRPALPPLPAVQDCSHRKRKCNAHRLLTQKRSTVPMPVHTFIILIDKCRKRRILLRSNMIQFPDVR